MFSGYKASHPEGGSGLARWQANPGAATTPSAQDLASGTTPQPQPGAGHVVDTTRAQAGAPPVRSETPAMRAAKIAASRRPTSPVGQPGQTGPITLRQPPPVQPVTGPPPVADPYAPPGYTPGVAAPAPPTAAPPPVAPYAVPRASDQMPIQPGFVANGDPVARSPLNIDGTALTGVQLAALAGTGLPGDPFGGGFTPNGGWNASNGGRSAAEQAAAVAAYRAQYGDPSVTAEQVRTTTSNNPDQVEAARRAYQEWQDSVGRFL